MISCKPFTPVFKDMKAVLYYFKSHKKIDGTLFYCFEYFISARQQDKNVSFIIYNISSEDLDRVFQIFREKYVFDESLLSSVKGYNSIHDFFQLSLEKALILDMHSFEKLHYFIKGDIVCYSNEPHEMQRSELKKITYFGFYDYQPHDYKERLKINFSIFAPLKKTAKTGKVMVSSRLYNYSEINIPDELKHMTCIYKHQNDHFDNLFEEIEAVYYFHSDLDTNNRLIPESYFYKKKVVVDYNGSYNDSVYLGHQSILKHGLEDHGLRGDELMLKAFLGQT